jgi:hypothetical protein
MGANAQTAVPTFTASQVLTAAQMNQSARTGVPVFATTTARNDAFGGSGEKTLAEGQLCYVEGTGLQTYNGSAWVTWGATSPGLVHINTTAFSAVTSVSLNSVFTSTYNNYRVVIISGDPATAQTFTMRMRVGGSDDTTSNYARMNASNTGGGGTETVTGTTTSWFSGYVGAGSLFYTDITVFRPQETANTSIAGFTISNNSTFTSISRWTIGGWFNATTSFDGFSLLMGANTTGTVRVYGYVNS